MEEFNKRVFMLAMNQAKRLTTEEFIKRAKQIYGDRFDYSETEYLTARNKVTISCPKHGSFTILPQHHLKENSISGGCRKCGLKAINRNRRFTQEQFLEKVSNIPNLSFEKTIYKDKRSKVTVTCKIHGDYETTPDILFKSCGCPKCKSSIGEKNIEEILKALNIRYFCQQGFKGLAFKKSLKFDFYLPYHNACIEFDGEQHFKSVEYWRGEKGFKELQAKDNLKNLFCKENNMPLLRIRFDEQNIESAIKEFLRI